MKCTDLNAQFKGFDKYVYSCNHNTHFHYPNKFSTKLLQLVSSPEAASSDCYHHRLVLPFPKPHKRISIVYTVLCLPEFAQ